MNEQLQNFAREKLREGLAQCTDAQLIIFKRMYSPKNMNADISEVVANMSDDKLDWAMQQVDRTVRKNLSSKEPS